MHLLRCLLCLPTPIMMTLLQTCWSPTNPPDCELARRCSRIVGTFIVRCGLGNRGCFSFPSCLLLFQSFVWCFWDFVTLELLKGTSLWRRKVLRQEGGTALLYWKDILQIQIWNHTRVPSLEHLPLGLLPRHSPLRSKVWAGILLLPFL